MSTLANIQKLMKIVSPVKAVETAMAPRIIQTAGNLRGGLQQTSQLLQQLKGKPGVKQAQIEQMFGHLVPSTKLSPEMLAAAAKKPKLLVQRSVKRAADEDAVQDNAEDLLWGTEYLDRRSELWAKMLKELEEAGDSTAGQLINNMPLRGPDLKDWEKAAIQHIDNMQDDPDFENVAGYTNDSIIDSDASREAWDQANAEAKRMSASFEPSYAQYQRQPPTRGDDYFENVLRAPPQRAREINHIVADNGESWPSESYHFGNSGQLGHVRGSISPNQQVMNLDEIQSDPLHALGEGALPELQGIYGKLGRSVLDRAAAANIPFVNIPTGAGIASVRDPSKRSFYNKLYDTTLNKELYEPLQDQGVKVNRSTGWNNIELTPELMEEIKKGNLLNYKNGGLARCR